jgi:UDPglucose 6-dehydrogenase
MRVSVMGAGYVGTSSAAVLGACGHDVTCVEQDDTRLQRWRRADDPLGEPGLAELLVRSKVNFVPDPRSIASADVVIVAVGTPPDDRGRPDITQVDAAAVEIAEYARDGTLVLVRSTVPVGTCDRLQNGPLRRLRVVSNPEFLREGRALHDAFFPDRIVAGGPPEAQGAFEELYRRIMEGRDLPGGPARGERVPVLWMSARSAELAKYAANGFLATKLSFVNEIANLAFTVGADASSVLGSMAFDPRIGPQYLHPGLGWGGSCFPKDTRALEAIAAGAGYDFVVLRAAIEQNTRQLTRFAAAIERAVPSHGRVGMLGLAFKAGTADVRASPAIALARRLSSRGLMVSAFDPAVSAIADEPGVQVRSTVVDACDGADAVAIATEWPEFATIDLRALRRVTRGDLLFDGRCLISPQSAVAAGFRYRSLVGFGD